MVQGKLVKTRLKTASMAKNYKLVLVRVRYLEASARLGLEKIGLVPPLGQRRERGKYLEGEIKSDGEANYLSPKPGVAKDDTGLVVLECQL